MKSSIRSKFTMGMIILFIIILVLSIFSGYYLNKLSTKTGAILKENYLSLVYARDMSEGVINISQEMTKSFLIRKNIDSLLIQNQLNIIDKALQAEKKNLTEPGEGKLVSTIEIGLKEYRDSTQKYIGSAQSSVNVLYLQDKSSDLHQQLVFLSQLNGNAIEAKTDDAKLASKSALTQMTILGTIGFLIALSITYNFASNFNERFLQLYHGIKEILSGNYDQRLFFEGKDEFYEISLVFNEMAEKFKNSGGNNSVTLPDGGRKNISSKDLEELRKMLMRIKSMEVEAKALISKLEEK
jgi:two-component system, NtrC family, sensor histidine kinase KinB